MEETDKEKRYGYIWKNYVLKTGQADNLQGELLREMENIRCEAQDSCFEQKMYKPELLFDDMEIVERVRNYPMALWKCREQRV